MQVKVSFNDLPPLLPLSKIPLSAILPPMNIETLTVGPLGVNCYILHDESGKGVVIDPGDEGAQIMATVKRLGIEVTHIINTHGHFDHIGANGYLKEATGAPLLIHEGDAEMLDRADIAAARFGLKAEPSPAPDKLISDGDTIESGSMKIRVIHTPGHSPGGVCLHAGDFLITGDSLFAGSVGRTDLPGGNHDQLLESVSSKIFTLKNNPEVYPGHGPKSSVDFEKQNNPFFTTGSFSF